MKKFKLVSGISLFAIALVLALMALLFPDNGLLAALWSRGLLTFRGEASRMIVYLASGVFAILGAGLLLSQARSKEDV